MRFTVIAAALLLSSSAFGKFDSLFHVYRTNYYTEKTLNYTVDLNSDCNFSSNPKFDIHFISTKTGDRLKGFTKYNQDYFGQNNVKARGNLLSFRFKALDEIGSKLGKTLSMLVRASRVGGSCEMTTELVSNSSTFFKNLNRIEVEFILNILGHPKDFKWVGLSGRAKEVCLYGPCP